MRLGDASPASRLHGDVSRRIALLLLPAAVDAWARARDPTPEAAAERDALRQEGRARVEAALWERLHAWKRRHAPAPPDS